MSYLGEYPSEAEMSLVDWLIVVAGDHNVKTWYHKL